MIKRIILCFFGCEFLYLSLFQYDKLTKLVKDFEPFRNLWLSVSDWLKMHDSVMNDPLISVDAESVEKTVTDSYKTMHKSVKIFSELPSVQEVAAQIKVSIEEFRPFIPLIQGLRNPGMRSRHWEQLSNELGMTIVPKANLNFSKCLEMRLQDHIQVSILILHSYSKATTFCCLFAGDRKNC